MLMLTPGPARPRAPAIRSAPAAPRQVPSGYKLDRMEEGDLVQKKASPLLERLDSAASGEAA